jgi:hypothetical protein
MIRHWETTRGDEWWYSDQIFEASGGARLTSPPTFEFSIEVLSKSEFSAGTLLFFLRRTRDEFPEFQLRCRIDPTVEPALNELKAEGKLQWELVDHQRWSEAVIVEISDCK